MNILIGADPELWIIDNETGKPISAEGLFEGTKAAPYKVERGAVQVDGMAAEFNINPAKDKAEFVLNTLSVLRDLRDLIKKNNPNLNFSFRFSPVAEFGAEYIAAQPEHAKELGCTPDYNAYNDGEANPTPDADMPFRTASGHIHVGWTNDVDITDREHLDACIMLVKQMDVYVGGPLSRIEGVEGAKRRALYGKAGAFRPKPYGVEYRTSSNNWLNTIDLMEAVYNLTNFSFRELIDGQRAYEMPYYEGTREAINTLNGNVDFANWTRKMRGTKINVHNLDQMIEYVKVQNNILAAPPIALRPAENLQWAGAQAIGAGAVAGNDMLIIDFDEADDIDLNDLDDEDDFEIIEDVDAERF